MEELGMAEYKKELSNIKKIRLTNIGTVIVQIHKSDNVIIESNDKLNFGIFDDLLKITYKYDWSSGIHVKGNVTISSVSSGSQIAIGNNIQQNMNSSGKNKNGDNLEVMLTVPVWMDIMLNGVTTIKPMFSESDCVTMTIEG
jgi:hypothetical protein